MNTNIQLSMLSVTSETGFSLDEFVITLNDLMHTKGMPGIAGFVLSAIQERLYLDLVLGNQGTWGPSEKCCEHCFFEIAQRRKRSIRSSIGTIEMPWLTLRCKNCRSTLVPLRQFLGLDLYQAKTGELERTVVEVASEQSYRRGSKHLDTIGMIPVPKSTAHRWVAQTECDEIDTGTDTMCLLLADGTGYKRRPDPATQKDNRGSVRIAFGIDKQGKTVPFGAWSGDDWDTIAGDVQGKRPDDKPVAEMLLSDGEKGLVQSMGKLCDSINRCHWHASKELGYAMWQDNAPLQERKKMTHELAGIIAIDLPEEDAETISPEDKRQISDATDAAEREVDNLCRRLLNKGYTQAYTYVRRMKHSLFTYVNRWLEWGMVSPRAASWIERTMREIARRLKRIAHGWSEPGAAKMARIVLKRFVAEEQWNDFWRKKLRLNGSVAWIMGKFQNAPTPLGR